ncbi:shikimate dehydrogenase [Microbacterium sediminicola]|uniref:Shikimate dehydrogenase n=1 Tax=Microbacterium sediminicola TaxID=415210 RepID=A0ABN2HTM4_9MICO
MTDRRALEVWGDPIAHSLSPQLHLAAYEVLGVDWSYERREVGEREFARVLASLDSTFRGLSVTAPLKPSAFGAATWRDRRAELTGAVNTLLLEDAGTRGFNTDVGGITASLAENGITSVADVRIIGAGATATSALVAAAELGASYVEVVARRPPAVAALQDLGDSLGVSVMPLLFETPAYSPVDLTIATLPGGARIPPDVADIIAEPGGPLLDVVYGRGPTRISEAWDRAGAPVITGEGMLLHQALLQVRIFAAGTADEPLDREEVVLAAMRRALVGG